uniref:Uncharacterized protein n=1 Tax=viral metagenome TaxID=1070528 RepID=A0A6C0HVM7_9ZZZZ
MEYDIKITFDNSMYNIIMKEITPFLYTSLYPYGCLDNFDQLQTALGPWMLTHENKKTWDSVSPTLVTQEPLPLVTEEPLPLVTEEPLPLVTQEPLPQVSPPIRRFSPRKPDSLFWSMFVAHYGVDSFFQIENKYMNRELEEKTHIMEFLGKNRSLQKSIKISVATGQEIMGDLMTNRQTTLMMLSAFAMYYKKHILVVSETSRTYHVFRAHTEEITDENVYVIYRSKGERSTPQYVTETTVTSETMNKIRTEYLQLDCIMKPLKGPGNFKMGDLEQMMEKLGIKREEDTKLKKGEMYEAIVKHCEVAWI